MKKSVREKGKLKRKHKEIKNLKKIKLVVLIALVVIALIVVFGVVNTIYNQKSIKNKGIFEDLLSSFNNLFQKKAVLFGPGDLALNVTGVTSSAISLEYYAAGATSYNIYISPEPDFALTKLIASTTETSYTITGVSAATDVFIRVEAVGAGKSEDSYARTVGGQNSVLDTELQEVHMVAPNVLELLLTNKKAWTYETTENWPLPDGDGGVNEVQNFTGFDWQGDNWTVQRANGSNLTITNVYRHSLPAGQKYYETGYGTGTNAPFIDIDHRIYLVFSEPIGQKEILTITHTGVCDSVPQLLLVNNSVGVNYMNITFGACNRNVNLFTILPFSDKYLETTSIQLNQVGYSPKATERYAYVSNWLGDGNGLNLTNFPQNASVLVDSVNPLDSRLIVLSNLNISTRYVLDNCNVSGLYNGSCYLNVSSGKCLASAPFVLTDCSFGAPVKDIDLSLLPESDTAYYRVYIPGVGVSWKTMVSDLAILKAFYVEMRGFYHERFGRDLQLEWTDWAPRPPDHPIIYQAEFKSFYGISQDKASTTALQIKPRSFQGGHHDAADWDMSTIHYTLALYMMRAFEINPSLYKDRQLAIPESGNGIPDILDEALYEIKGWEMLQDGTDEIGTACDICPDDPENDIDADGVCGNVDNCRYNYNPLQEDTDGDGYGDACDNSYTGNKDKDGDGIDDFSDNCVGINNSGQSDKDYEGIGDACDPCPDSNLNDIDGDGICEWKEYSLSKLDAFDNCPFDYNPNQTDCDNDGIGDACDAESYCSISKDSDSDGVLDYNDNCPNTYNPNQSDSIIEDGGIRARVEAERHPSGISYADEDEMPYFTWSRDPLITMVSAGMFAQASRLLLPYDQSKICGSVNCKSLELKDRAVRAYNWALSNGLNASSLGPVVYASSELYVLTGEDKYRQMFDATGVYSGPSYSPIKNYVVEPWKWWAFWVGKVSSIQRDFILDYFSNSALFINQTYLDITKLKILEYSQTEYNALETGLSHRFGMPPGNNPAWGTGSAAGRYAAQSIGLLQMDNFLSNGNKYTSEQKQEAINTISLSVDHALGGNPMGYSWTNGLGTQFPRQFCYNDGMSFIADGFKEMPYGISLYGPASCGYDGARFVFYPDISNMPSLYRYGDAWTCIAMDEFTVQETMAPQTIAAAVLLDSNMMPPISWLPGYEDHQNPLPTNGAIDTNPPLKPSNLQATVLGSNKIILTWNPSVDAETAITFYYIYKNGKYLGYVRDTQFVDSELNPSTVYIYEVSALDKAFNEGSKSGVSASTSADASGPVIESVSANDPYTIKIIFNEDVDNATASDITHYSIAPSVVIYGAVLNTFIDNRTVLLSTDALDPTVKYNLSYNGILDKAIEPNAGSGSMLFKYEWAPQQRDKFLLWNGETEEDKNAVFSFGRIINSSMVNDSLILGGNWAFEGTGSTSNLPGFQLSGSDYRINVSHYDTFMFWIKSEAIGENLSFKIADCCNHVANVTIAQFIEGGRVDTKYRLVTIPFYRLINDSVITGRLQYLYFGKKNSLYKVYVDNVWVVKTGNITCIDNDLDSYNQSAFGCGTADCNDANAFINPGAVEICDGVDNNCINGIDESCGDTTPPAKITNLQNPSKSQSWIYWTWNNPADLDFNSTIVYVDAVNKINTTNNYYNSTNLTCNTTHNILINTKDNSGNINNTPVASIITTSACSDLTIPQIKIVYPLNNVLLGTNNFEVKYIAADNNLEACWYTRNNGITNISIDICGQNITGQTWNENSNTVRVHARDEAGNTNSSSVAFNVDTLSPAINIVSPQAANYNTAVIYLNASANDAHLDKCWYKLDSGANNYIICGQNTTLIVTEGQHTLTYYANDTLGHQNNSTVVFSYDTTMPSIILNSPLNNAGINHVQNIKLDYTPSDANGLISCQLWIGTSADFRANTTTNSPANNTLNSFYLNMSEGNYLWNVLCTNTRSKSDFHLTNFSFIIDIISPFVNITYPLNNSQVTTTFAFNYTINDANIENCYYNFLKTSVWVYASNKSIPCHSNATDTLNPGNYELYLWAQDKAENINLKVISLSVVCDSGTIQCSDGICRTDCGSGGGGGGGGGCTPRCTGKQCGSNSCGGFCGSLGGNCSLGYECTTNGTCIIKHAEIIRNETQNQTLIGILNRYFTTSVAGKTYLGFIIILTVFIVIVIITAIILIRKHLKKKSSFKNSYNKNDNKNDINLVSAKKQF